VKIILPNGETKITPDLSSREMIAHASYVNSCTGLSLSSQEIAILLHRMGLRATVSQSDEDEIVVEVPPTRPDILHECDIMEDAAIAYGFNNLPDKFPATSTVAQPLAINKLSDVIRTEWAMAGWVEVLPLILVSQSVSRTLEILIPPVSVLMKKTLHGSIKKIPKLKLSKLPIQSRWNSKWYGHCSSQGYSRRSVKTGPMHCPSKFSKLPMSFSRILAKSAKPGMNDTLPLFHAIKRLVSRLCMVYWIER
jgi:hypothetical protein